MKSLYYNRDVGLARVLMFGIVVLYVSVIVGIIVLEKVYL